MQISSLYGRFPRRTVLAACSAALLVGFAGCGAPEAEFRGNLVYVHRKAEESNTKFEPQQQADIANILAAYFGTPDDPHMPQIPGLELNGVVDGDRLKMSAGRVASDRTGQPVGLYREHCVHCHGITGDGAGPTAAFLNPYPRDYRMGRFKFKSTLKGQRPTHDDLKRILMEGVAGTAMPSFKVLDGDEVESLVHYVKYLAIRGEVERRLTDELADLDEGARLIGDASDKEKDPAAYQEKVNRLNEIVTEVAQAWIEADGQAVAIEERSAGWKEPDALQASIARGREIFYGPIANCVKCHGDSALGDGQVTDYDDWTKEIEPTKPEALEKYLSLGALPPRNIRPRNLRLGIYRGGRRPIDLYWRIVNGIDGTPMPAVPMQTPDNAKGLTQDDVWSLVDYVLSLPYEAMSKQDKNQPQLDRERL
ncbi:MAG: cytochrome c [Pirellulales bacterium]